MSGFGPRNPFKSSPGQADKDESSDDDYGPSLPPSLAAARARVTSSEVAPKATPRARTVIGPTLPPTAAPVHEDSDDEVGPSPPPASTPRQDEHEGVKAFLEAEERRNKGLQVNHVFYHTGGNFILMNSRMALAPRS